MGFKSLLIISLALLGGAVFIGVIAASFQRETTSRLLKYGPGSFILSPSEVDQTQGSLPAPNPTDAPLPELSITHLQKTVRNLTQNDENFQKVVAIREGETAEFRIDLTAVNLSSREATIKLNDLLDAGIGVDETKIKFTITPPLGGEVRKPERWINADSLEFILKPLAGEVKLLVLFEGRVGLGLTKKFLTNKIEATKADEERRRGDKAHLIVIS